MSTCLNFVRIPTGRSLLVADGQHEIGEEVLTLVRRSGSQLVDGKTSQVDKIGRFRTGDLAQRRIVRPMSTLLERDERARDIANLLRSDRCAKGFCRFYT